MPSPGPDKESTAAAPRRHRVWLAEDSATEAEYLRGVLARDHEVEVFPDGLGFTERWAATRELPDAVLLDWEMPHMSGIEVCRWLRDRGVTQPVFLLTAHASSARVATALADGATDFVSKPAAADELRARIAGAIRTHQRAARTEVALDEERRRVSAAEEALRLSDMLVGIIGHDLRSPLQAISVATRLLVEQPPSAEGVRRVAARIDASTRRMSTMIEEVLDLTRARLAGGIPVERAEADLVAICRAVIDEVAPAFPGHAVRLEGDPEVRGRFDAGRMAQVVSNLLTNALVHGAREAPVEVTVVRGAIDVVLSVHNHGELADELLPTLFDPFRRRSARSRGLGLGLYIAQQIIAAHGGQIEVVRNRGTLFAVRLPSG